MKTNIRTGSYLSNSRIRIVSDKALVPSHFVALRKLKEEMGVAAYHFISRSLHSGHLTCGVKVMKRMGQRMGPIYIDYGEAERFYMEKHKPRRKRGESNGAEPDGSVVEALPPHVDHTPAGLTDVLGVVHVERELLVVLHGIEEKMELNNTLTGRLIERVGELKEVWS